MGTFLEATGRHYGQINGAAQVDEVGIRLIFDFQLPFFLFIVIILAAIIRTTFIFFTLVTFAKDFGLEFLVGFFILLIVGVKFEDVEPILYIDLVVQTRIVRDLIVLFDKVQFIFDGRKVFVLILSNLKEYFNHVLYALVDVGFVKDVSELVVNRHRDLCLEFFQVLANFLHQTNRYFDTVIRGFLQKKKQYLRSQVFMDDLLVDEMCQEGCATEADALVVAPEGFAKLNDESIYQEFPDLRQLGIDDRCHCSVYVCEGKTCRLSFHDTPTEQAFPSNEVLAK